MTDPFENLFAEARIEAVRQIQPPGAVAAHQVVRRRRTVGLAAVALAVLVVAGGSTLLAQQRSAAPAPASTRSVDDGLPGIARGKLAKGGPAIEAADPVTAGYSRQYATYVGNLTFELACAGKGRITLVIEGIPNKETGESAPVEQARATAVCSADPARSAVRFSASKAISYLVVRLADGTDAIGHAGFAYRLTSDAGVLMKPDDKRADPGAVLPTTGEAVEAKSDLMWVHPIDLHMTELPRLTPGTYQLAAACGGSGVATIQVRSGNRVLVNHDVPCQWQPKRADIAVGVADSSVSTWVAFRTPAGNTAPARIAWAWIRA